jgi:Leucine Rich repeat
VALAGALTTNTALMDLELWRNEIGDARMEALGQALMRNNSLEELNVSGNTGLKVNTSLTRLDLRRNSIGDVGARLSRSIPH